MRSGEAKHLPWGGTWVINEERGIMTLKRVWEVKMTSLEYHAT